MHFIQDFAACTETDKIRSDGVATAWVELFKILMELCDYCHIGSILCT